LATTTPGEEKKIVEKILFEFCFAIQHQSRPIQVATRQPAATRLSPKMGPFEFFFTDCPNDRFVIWLQDWPGARDDKRSSDRPHWNFGALVTASPGGFYRCLLGGHLQTGPEKTWNGAIQNGEVDPILDEKSARFK
jgi:hypothetical protein